MFKEVVTLMFSLALDSSQLVDYLTCPTLWYWRNKRLLQSKTLSTTSMDKGSYFHALLEKYYDKIILGANPFDAQRYAITCLTDELKLPSETISFLRQRFAQYVISYLNTDFVPAKSEQGFSMVLYESSDFYFVLEGRIDFIGRTKDGSQQIFMDHKCQERYHWLYPRSIQFKNYALATGIGTGVINYVGMQQTVNDKTFRREPFTFSRPYLEQWRQRMIRLFFSISHTLMTSQFVSESTSNLSACQNNGWGWPCQFVTLCDEPNEKIREALVSLDFDVKERWEPWRLKPNEM